MVNRVYNSHSQHVFVTCHIDSNTKLQKNDTTTITEFYSRRVGESF